MAGKDRSSILGLRRVVWYPKTVRVFTRGTSLRRRVAYSLAIVRLILVPVILLAVYYLFALSWIVDRIVSVDAQVATLAENASIDMLNARRIERNYFLLHNLADLEGNRQALANLLQTLDKCLELQPQAQTTIQKAQGQVQFYRDRFEQAATRVGEHGQTPTEQLQDIVKAYQRKLNRLLRGSSHESRDQLLEELRNQLGSLDIQIAATLEAEDPALRQTALDLQTSSAEILKLLSDLEQQGLDRVRRDHEEARRLVRRAEEVLIIVSALALLLSVLVSFILPREVVKPLVDLKAAVDHAAAGNYEIEFDVQGEGEVVQLANSVRRLIAHVREKKENSTMK